MLVDCRDPNSESFNFDGNPLRIEVEDIQFLTELLTSNPRELGVI